MTRPSLWRLVEWRLRRKLPALALDTVLGDLIEDYRRDRASHGWLRAELRTWREASSLLSAYGRPTALLPSVWQDVRGAVRSYRRTPLFTCTVLLTLGLGIGGNSAIFTLVDAVLLKPLPYAQPQQLAQIYQVNRSTGQRGAVSPPTYFDLRNQTRAFKNTAAYWTPSISISGGGADPEKVLAVTCSHELFDVLAVPPAFGRAFSADDDRPGASLTVILSDALWQRRFGGDVSAIGKDLILDGAPARIVGVMPARFAFPAGQTEMWVPLRLSATQPPNPAIKPAAYRRYRILSVVGRMNDDVSVEAARAQLTTWWGQQQEQFPEANHGLDAAIVPLHDVVTGTAQAPLTLLVAAIGCVLLVACANVGGLMLVRATARSREVSIQLALGASRWRVVRQVLTESMVIAVAGGALGLAVGTWMTRALVRLAPASTPRLSGVHTNWTVAAFTLLLAVAAGLLFGMAPAFHARRRDVANALRSSGRSTVGGTHHVLRHGLVLSQIAVSLTLLIGAALLIQSLAGEARIDTGFKPAQVLTLDRVELPRQRAQPEASASFFTDLLSKVRALPDVDSAAATLGLPLDPRARFFVDDTRFSIEGRPALPPNQQPSAPLHVVTSGYFASVGVPVLAGRAFTDQDRAGSQPVVVINRALAARFFGDRDPIGQRLTHELSIVPGQATTREIVGVVGDVRHFGLEQPADAQMYIPHPQMPWPSMALVIRSRADAAALGRSVREAVWSLDRTIPAPPLRAMTAVVSDTLAEPRFRAWLVGIFAGLAWVLATIGIYGSMAYAVEQSRREIGLRMALGATPHRAGARVRRTGLSLLAWGSALGLLAAYVLTRPLSNMLYGITAADPITFAAAAAVVGFVGWLACYVPTRRAGRISPSQVLGSDL